jgi:predicted lipoprotein with Yx(FWY)xxD motif
MSAFGIGKLSLGTAGATALVALVAGCGSSSKSSTTPAAAGSSASQSQPATGSTTSLKSKSTSIGNVLVDASGRTVYELVGDSVAHSTCTGACLSIWPPVKQNGTQVVVNGHPVYTFVSDSAPGQTKGQNFTDQWGKWLALDASGNPISGSTAPSQGPASSKASNGGGAAF